MYVYVKVYIYMYVCVKKWKTIWKISLIYFATGIVSSKLIYSARMKSTCDKKKKHANLKK